MNIEEAIKKFRPIVGDPASLRIRDEYTELQKLCGALERPMTEARRAMLTESRESKKRYIVSLIEEQLSPQ